MVIFVYDKTFEGLLTAVFDAYFRKTFPDLLLAEGEPLPLFYEEVLTICSDEEKSARVWKSLKKKLSPFALAGITTNWLSELSGVDNLLFKYICKVTDSPVSVEMNFGDPIVLEFTKLYKKVRAERYAILQFLRFQKATDDVFFAAVEPLYNILPLTISHFKDRFSDQKWLIYDLKRQYGYYYDCLQVTEISFEDRPMHLVTGKLDESLMAADEKLLQSMWKTYFKSIAIKERTNPRLQRRSMPVRFWKYLTEKQG